MWWPSTAVVTAARGSRTKASISNTAGRRFGNCCPMTRTSTFGSCSLWPLRRNASMTNSPSSTRPSFEARRDQRALGRTQIPARGVAGQDAGQRVGVIGLRYAPTLCRPLGKSWAAERTRRLAGQPPRAPSDVSAGLAATGNEAGKESLAAGPVLSRKPEGMGSQRAQRRPARDGSVRENSVAHATDAQGAGRDAGWIRPPHPRQGPARRRRGPLIPTPRADR